jgi:ketosteroid isomerase-like protein
MIWGIPKSKGGVVIRKPFRLMLCILFLIAILVGCSKPVDIATPPTPPTPPTDTLLPPTPTLEPSPTAISPREPASAAEVERIASAFDAVNAAQDKAWMERDFDAARSFYTDDVVFTEVSMGDHFSGLDRLIDMQRNFFAYIGPNFTWRITDSFISKNDSLATTDNWGFSMGNNQYTKEDPFLFVGRFQTRANRISSWTIYEGAEYKDSGGIVDKGQFGEANLLFSSYGTAWSSGDPSTVNDLYDDNAIREDTIFGEQQEGSTAITSFAKSFFNWYPGVQWTLHQVFGEWAGESPTIGGTFSIKATDSTNQPCEVLVAVLLQAYEGKIAHESLYYEPDSLIKCGWAK